MPGKKSIPVDPLTSIIKGGIREHMFDLAHYVLDSLESAIIRLRNLEAIVFDTLNNPKLEDHYPIVEPKTTANHMRQFQGVEQLVDGPLFAGGALMDIDKFDSSIGPIVRDVEARIPRLEKYIVKGLGKLPDEIPSGKIRAQRDVMHQELANLHGSSELPSLAKGVLKTLQSLLDRAKSLALECILCGENHFNNWEAGGLGELLDCAEHMTLLQQYITHSQYGGQTITKFMAGKFDRSAARLDCLLRAYIMCYEGLPKEGTPIELDIPSLRAACKVWGPEVPWLQSRLDDTALQSLLDEYPNVLGQTPSTVRAVAHHLEDRANIAAIGKRQIMARSLRTRPGGRYSLGTDFVENAFAIFHGLMSADMETLGGLISDVKMLKSK